MFLAIGYTSGIRFVLARSLSLLYKGTLPANTGSRVGARARKQTCAPNGRDHTLRGNVTLSAPRLVLHAATPSPHAPSLAVQPARAHARAAVAGVLKEKQ